MTSNLEFHTWVLINGMVEERLFDTWSLTCVTEFGQQNSGHGIPEWEKKAKRNPRLYMYPGYPSQDRSLHSFLLHPGTIILQNCKQPECPRIGE